MDRKWNRTRHLKNWHLNEFKCQTPVLDSLLNIHPKQANVQDGLTIRLCHQLGFHRQGGMGGKSIKFCSPKSANGYFRFLVLCYREENLIPSFKN